MKKLFLYWGLWASITVVLTIIALVLNLFSEINRLDASKISFIILAIFYGCLIWCGMLTWEASQLIESGLPAGKEYRHKALKDMTHRADHIWFASQLCKELGYLGTIVGLLMAFTSLAGLETTEQEALKKFLQEFAGAMFTAAITTVVGIICGTILSLTCQNLSSAVDRRLSEVSDD